MNKLFLVITLVFSCQFLIGQNFITVNNTPGSSADYAEIQDAVDAASNNDIIIVQGSANSYADVVVRNKTLAIVGPGYFHGLNPDPYTQATPGVADLGRITIGGGANNTLVTGMSIARVDIDTASGVKIVRCYVHDQFDISRCANSQVTQCYIDGYYRTYYCSSAELSYSIINYSSSWTFYALNNGTGPSVANLDIFNNVIVASGQVFNGTGVSSGQSIILAKNNIVITSTGSVMDTIPGAFHVAANNNVCTGNYMSNGSNTLINQTTAALFDNFSSTSTDGKYQLSATSPAKGYGISGIDCGPFTGSSDDYVLSGIPFLPNIYFLDVPSVGTTNGGIDVRVKARGNN